MKNAKIKKPSIIMSLIGIVMSVTMLMGATFAWFTDGESSDGNIIKSGSLEVSAYWMDATEDPSVDANWKSFSDGAVFDYDKWEPGYVEAKHLMVKNDGDLAFKYKLLIVPSGAVSELANVIDVYCVDQATKLTSRNMIAQGRYVGTLADLIADEDGAAYGVLLPKDAVAKNPTEVVESKTLTIALKMREETTNDYSNMSIGTNFSLKVFATQYEYEEDTFGNDYDANASYPDVWDGTTDFSWYDESQTNYSLTSAEQFAGFGALVNGKAEEAGVSGAVSFKDKTITLEADVDLSGIIFEPIGNKTAFEGTFDGNGNTISNLAQNGWAFGYEWGKYGSIGLFGEVNGATIKNVTVSGTDAQIEGGDIGGVVGSATGECVFENITVSDSDFGTYNNGIGGIVGWTGEGTYTFKNINIAEDVVLGGLWGSFDSSIGGVVGQAEPGATYVFENVNVACRLDAYNDCTASYQYYNYRMCGMLIGRLEETTTIDGTNYPDITKYNITCENVTVTFGEWANYHYCYGFNGSRYTRVEAGYTYGGLDVNAEGHTDKCTDHMLLLPFDGIFGGDQLGVKPLLTYDGVTVIYNNK